MLDDAETLERFDELTNKFKNETDDPEAADLLRDSLCRRFPLYVATVKDDTTRTTLFNRFAQLLEYVGSVDMEGATANQIEMNANDAETLADAFAKAARPGYVPGGFARNLRSLAAERFELSDDQDDWSFSLPLDRAAAALSDLADYVEPLEKPAPADTAQETQRDINVKRPWKIKRPLGRSLEEPA